VKERFEMDSLSYTEMKDQKKTGVGRMRSMTGHEATVLHNAFHCKVYPINYRPKHKSSSGFVPFVVRDNIAWMQKNGKTTSRKY
jgi:hypothetical protein